MCLTRSVHSSICCEDGQFGMRASPQTYQQTLLHNCWMSTKKTCIVSYVTTSSYVISWLPTPVNQDQPKCCCCRVMSVYLNIPRTFTACICRSHSTLAGGKSSRKKTSDTESDWINFSYTEQLSKACTWFVDAPSTCVSVVIEYRSQCLGHVFMCCPLAWACMSVNRKSI